MMPFAGQHFTTRWVFMQDGDRKQGSPHVKGSSKLMRAWFSRNRVRVLDHPPQNPDLNPIEHCGKSSNDVPRAENSETKTKHGNSIELSGNAYPEKR